MLGKTHNGGDTIENNFTFPVGASIASGGVYVACSNQIDPGNYAQCDQLDAFVAHNGDDV
jgi:hypothetical protein